MAAEDLEMKLTETLHRSSLAAALLQATRDYDAAAIRARTSWDDHTAAGGIVYRPDSPNPDQQTINDILDDKE